MRLTKFILQIVVVLFAGLGCIAQQTLVSQKLQFHSINQVGLLVGEKGGSFQAQTINGVQHKTFFAGFGVGIDGYRLRSVPVFIDLRKEFGSSENKFFIYSDAGINCEWLTADQKYSVISAPKEAVKFSKGFYMDAGLGYRIAMKNKNSLLLNIGYSYKRIKERQDNSVLIFPPPWGAYPDFGDNYQTSVYDLNRVAIKIGWEF